MRLAVVSGAALLFAGGAHGQELVATRPGVMCRSADALAKLTLPNGDSRTHTAPRPGDMALAAAGGCIDIPRGARVTVRQAFRNTSIASYGAPDAPPYVIPNVDFRAATDAGGGAAAAAPAPSAPVLSAPAPSVAAVPPSDAVVQRMLLPDPGSGSLVVLEDSRLTPLVREALWGKGTIENAVDGRDPLVADVNRRPLLNARLQLLSSAGAVLAETPAEYPLAKVELAPIHGLPTPGVLFTVDMSAGWGGFSGPAVLLLTPATTQLAPVRFVSDRTGKSEEISLATTLHAGWRIVPGRDGGPEEIESAYCRPGGGERQAMTLWTFRFHDGQWHGVERQGGPCADMDDLPPRSAFP